MFFISRFFLFVLFLFTTHPLFSDLILKEKFNLLNFLDDSSPESTIQMNFRDELQKKSVIKQKNAQKLRVIDCLLPQNHWLHRRLKNLFLDPEMFESPEHLSEKGFQVIEREDRRLMVASHPKLKHYLIKKFQNEVSNKRQLRNYLCRINGAEKLREFIHANKLRHIVTPKKWLYRLPVQFSNLKNGKCSYVLIVEKMDICGNDGDCDEEIAKKYYELDFEVLRELCIVVYHFRGLDSALRNMPFTDQNKIAFIDTEGWNCERDGFLDRALPFMSPDRQKYALEVFRELSQ